MQAGYFMQLIIQENVRHKTQPSKTIR